MKIGQFSFHWDTVKKAILASAAFAVLTAPLATGLPSPALAQTMMQANTDTPEKIAERRAEQATPRKAVTFDPAQFDKYAGYYEMTPTAVFTIRRDGSHFLLRLTGQQDVEVFPESDSKFFATVVAAQISFHTDASGKATDLVLHQAGMERAARALTKPPPNNWKPLCWTGSRTIPPVPAPRRRCASACKAWKPEHQTSAT